MAHDDETEGPDDALWMLAQGTALLEVAASALADVHAPNALKGRADEIASIQRQISELNRAFREEAQDCATSSDVMLSMSGAGELEIALPGGPEAGQWVRHSLARMVDDYIDEFRTDGAIRPVDMEDAQQLATALRALAARADRAVAEAVEHEGPDGAQKSGDRVEDAIVEWLENYEATYTANYADVDDRGDAVLDGHFDLRELAKVARKAVEDERRLMDHGKLPPD